MDLYLNIGFLILLFLIFLFINNYKIIMINPEKFRNKFTNDNCCTHNNIGECNKYGKTCVCDYFKKNSYICQDSY